MNNHDFLTLDLVKSVGVYFRLGKKEMDSILVVVQSAVLGWQKVATEIGILRNEQALMAAAFKI